MDNVAEQVQDTGAEEAVVNTQVTEEVAPNGVDKSPAQTQKPKGDLGVALKEERERRKELQQKFSAMEEKQNKLNQRLASIFSDEETPQKAVDFNENPAEYLKNKVEKTEKSTEELSGFFKQQRAMTELQGYAQSSVAAMKKDNPDYDAAYEFARQDRLAEIMELEECTEAEALEQVNREELNLTIQSAQKGKNPAKAIYAYAKRRGYKPAEGESSVSEAEQTIDRIQKGQSSSKSLSSTSGKSPSSLTIDKILAMGEEEFSEFKAKNPRKLRELMGDRVN